jgi:hypothetical protein
MQVELFKRYAAGFPDEYLADIKRMIAKYLFEKARDRADRIRDERGYSEETFKKMGEWR